MKFPLRSTVQIGRYVASQKGNDRYPLVIMLEPTLGCNIACIGCGKIREYESNKARLTVDECLQSAVECPAPVVSVCGGEPLIFKGIEEVVAGFVEMKRNVQLCTNALRLVDMLDKFEPNPRLTFVVHLDGMQEIHDYICDYPGLWEVAVDAIRAARENGFRVTTNTTIFKETEVDDVIEMMGYLTNEVGIDGMLVAPGYQYSQIDPNLTMTRDEHEVKFRLIRDCGQAPRLPLAGEPRLPGLPHRRAQASVRAVGLRDAQPVRLEGPLLPPHGRDLPDVRGARERDRVGAVRPRQRPPLRALRDPLRLRARRHHRDDLERQGDRQEPRMDTAVGVAESADALSAKEPPRRSRVLWRSRSGRPPKAERAARRVGLGAREGLRRAGRSSPSGSRARSSPASSRARS